MPGFGFELFLSPGAPLGSPGSARILASPDLALAVPSAGYNCRRKAGPCPSGNVGDGGGANSSRLFYSLGLKIYDPEPITPY